MQPPEAPLTFTVQATRGDVVFTAVELMLASPSVIIGAAGLTVVATSTAIGVPFDAFQAFGLVGGVLFFSGLLVAPFQWWAVSRRPDLMTGPVTVDASDDGLRMVLSTATSEVAWPTFKSFLETSGAFALQTGIASHVVPKRGMTADQLQAFRILLLRRGQLRHARDVAPWLKRVAIGVAVGLAMILVPAGLAVMSGPR